MSPPWIARALALIVAAAIPVILVGNGLLLLVNPWLVDAQYALPGFPDDQLGLDDRQRADLAVTGLRSVRPLDDGVTLLRDARLPDEGPAFNEREISHMADVRAVIAGFAIAWAVALCLALAAIAPLRRFGEPGALRAALTRGGTLTLVLVAFVAVVALIDFDGFFEAFHGVFFEGDSWIFDPGDTLRQLYPDTFWAVAAAAIIALTVLQAAVLVVLGKRSPRQPRDAVDPPRPLRFTAR